MAQRVPRLVRRPADGRRGAGSAPPGAAVGAVDVGLSAPGPLIDWSGEIDAWLDPLADYPKMQGAFAIRLAPPVRTNMWSAPQIKDGIADPDIKWLTEMPSGQADPVGDRVISRLMDTGWLPQSPEDDFGPGQPQFTYEVPLRHPDSTSRTEDDLLSGMNQRWLRNIRKAAKEGVQVTTSTRSDDLRAFHDLYVHTAERDRFTPRPLRYFETMFAELSAEDPERIRLYLAHPEGDLIAATSGVRVGAYAWYSYGASSTEKREVRGFNACQWAMIRDALAAGCDVYDLRGIIPPLDADDPHVGLIRSGRHRGPGGAVCRRVGPAAAPDDLPGL